MLVKHVRSAIDLPDRARGDEADPWTPLGEFMLRRNSELGLSVSAVAQRVGMSRATWYRIARGEVASPGVRVLRGLSRVYRVPAAELLALAGTSGMPRPGPTTQATAPTQEPGDALWRCRHQHQVQTGSWVDVYLALLNLSDSAWLGAEVRTIHDRWLAFDDSSDAQELACGNANGPTSGRTALPPTGPGDWAVAHLRLRAPQVAGRFALCLVLHTAPAQPPVGTTVALFLEAK
ncbi:MAG: helix-turn-helix domain-containing protein [Burkholderiales bacterium]|nr:helix-turn-helix domain-containing protein [Burkholderiales bacterium]